MAGKAVISVDYRMLNNKMMRPVLITLFAISFFYASHAQENNPAAWVNNFQKFTSNSPNSDSAIFYVRKLASDKRYAFILSDLLHKSFAQEFLQRPPGGKEDRVALNQQLLHSKQVLSNMAADTNVLLSQSVRPLYLWTKVQDNRYDPAVLSQLCREFLNGELGSGEVYTYSRGRYGMMIYQIISRHEVLKPLAENIYATIFSSLKNNQLTATDSSSRPELDRRAWFRYLFAYANYIKAMQTSDLKNKETLLKTAFDYSPDLIDKNHYAAYFYDMIFLFAGEDKPTFKGDYVNFLMGASNDNSEIASTLLKIALIEPEYKTQLKAFYNQHNTESKSFDDYWQESINAGAKKALPVTLRELNEKPFDSGNLSGKWILVDFWGTWCAPCRQEHPGMQKFYDSIVLKRPDRIALMTVACRDSKEKVIAYLKDRKYSFPVAMSDGKIEETYAVQGYPTKILITPEAKYLIVPFGVDWVNFVKQYCDL